MDHLNPEIARLFAAKQRRRARLAAQPFPEKVREVVQMQRMAAPVLRARGKRSGCGSWNPSTSDLGHSPPWLTKEIGHRCFRAAQPRLAAVVIERPAAAAQPPFQRTEDSDLPSAVGPRSVVRSTHQRRHWALTQDTGCPQDTAASPSQRRSQACRALFGAA
jgi:hypothetical protein